MDRQAVESQSIRSVGYDERAEALEVEFRSGGVYRYAGVPRAVYEELLGAESKGRYFQKWIREQYPAQRVDRPAEERTSQWVDRPGTG